MKREFNYAIVLDVHRTENRFGHIYGFIAMDVPHKDNGFDSLPYGDNLGGLHLHSQTSEGNEAHIYAWEIGVKCHGHVTAYEAEKILKTLRPIERKLSAMYQDEGNPANYGQWVNRVARAIGATRIILREHGKVTRDNPGKMVYPVNMAAQRLVDWSANKPQEQAAA